VIIHLWADGVIDMEIQWRQSAIMSWRKRLVCGLPPLENIFFFLNGTHKLVKYWVVCTETQEGYVQKLCTCVSCIAVVLILTSILETFSDLP
jgi:hypothetical protein